MRAMGIGLLGVLLSIALLAQETQPPSPKGISLKDDPRLQVPVSFHERYLPLNEFTKRLSQATGVSISVSREYAEEKLTLFVKNRPAWEVMTHAVEVLGLQWGEGVLKGSYRILRSRKRMEEEAEYQRKLEQERQELLERMKALQEETRKSITEWLKPDEKRPSLRGINDYLVGRWIATWGQEEWQRFWQGERLVGSYPPRQGLLALPSEVPLWFREYLQIKPEAFFSEPPEESPRNLSLPEDLKIYFYIIIQYEPDKIQANHCVIIQIEGSLTEGVPQVVEYSSSIAGLSVVWQSAPSPELPEELAQVKLKRLSQNFPCGKAQRRCGLAEQLEWLSERCEVPIIAQAFRVRLWNRLNAQAENLLECVKPLQLSNRVEYKNGYLLIRYHPLSSSQYRRTEIPESLVLEMERRAEKKGALDLEDYAWLASRLTPQQSAQLNTYKHDLLLPFDIVPLSRSIPALRFWGSLTETQKQQALRGKPLPYHRLTPAQQRLYLEAVMTNSECASDVSLTKFLSFSPSLFGGRETESWMFSLTFQEGTLYIAFSGEGMPLGQTFTTGEGQFSSSGEFQRFSARQAVFSFGIGEEDSVEYHITLRQPQPKKEKNTQPSGK